MSLEEKIDELIVALNKNTAAHAGKGGAAAEPAASGKRKPAAAAADEGPKVKADDVKAALMKVKEDVGTPAAKKIISDAGADDMADLLTKPKLFAKVMTACEAALEGGGDEEDEGDGL
jgi:hypothetical protein